MLCAVIHNYSSTLVLDLPASIIDMQMKLNSIGIKETIDNIRISDEDGQTIHVKLYATELEEAHLRTLLTPDKTLADANISMMMLQRASHFSYNRVQFIVFQVSKKTSGHSHSIK